jgi:hypothetical protein
MLYRVLPSVVGCPEETALDHLIEAAREFCARTLVWNYQAMPIDSAAGVPNYTLQIAQGQNLVRLLTCEVNGQTYSVPSSLSGRAAQRAKSGNTAVVEANNDFRLEPAPYLSGLKIITDIAVKPTRKDPHDWPDDLEEYVTDIARGAVASLCRLPKVTWSDDKTAAAEHTLFTNRMGTVAFKVSKGFGRSSHGAALRWF